MEWWQIILMAAVVAIAGVMGEVYLRLAPLREKRNIESNKAITTIRNTLQNNTLIVEFKLLSLGEIEEIANNIYLPKKLRRDLREIIGLATEYSKWRYECYEVINAEVRAQSKQYPILDEAFMAVFHSDFESTMNGIDGSRSEEIYKAIYKGILTFEIMKESVLKGRWESKIKIRYKSIEEQEMMFKDILESEYFHRVFKELVKLQDREPIKLLRNIQARLLQKVQLLLEEVPHVPTSS
jgi:hypothetical protein